MSLTIRNVETVGMIERLARESSSMPEEVLSRAMEAEAEREKRVRRLMEAAEKIQQRWANMPKSGLKADKAFFDDLGGEL